MLVPRVYELGIFLDELLNPDQMTVSRRRVDGTREASGRVSQETQGRESAIQVASLPIVSPLRGVNDPLKVAGFVLY